MSGNAIPPAASDSAGESGFADSAAEMEQLRELLLGGEIGRLRQIEERLGELGLSVEELADVLPEAIALRNSRDNQLEKTLMPTIEDAIGESVRKRPDEITNAIFPILGPAIRKSIAQALADLVANINRTIENDLSWQGIQWRIEAWRTGVPYPQVLMRHSLVYRVEQVFLIHRETGLLLQHAAVPELDTADGDMVSGMLTAIRDFVQDSFSGGSEGELRTFAVGEMTVVVEQGPYAMIASVVRGQAPESLHVVLEEALETVHIQFAPPMRDFDGDTDKFEQSYPILAECLQTEYSRAKEEKRGAGLKTKLLVVWVVIFFVLFWVGFGYYRSARRWEGAQEALRATPGIVLIEADRFLGKWEFVELRDPLAGDPNMILNERGVDTTDVSHSWTSYISVEPEMIVARGRGVTDAPDGVDLEFSEGTLFVSGVASADWWERAAATLPLVTGVTEVDWSRYNRSVPATVAAAAQQIEGYVITFASGSANPENGDADIQAGAADILTLVAESDRWGWEVSVEIAGRTDSTGGDEINRVLSAARAERVREGLVRSGVDPAILNVVGLGDASPMLVPGAEDLQRLNRSVTFVVTTTPIAEDEESR